VFLSGFVLLKKGPEQGSIVSPAFAMLFLRHMTYTVVHAHSAPRQECIWWATAEQRVDTAVLQLTRNRCDPIGFFSAESQHVRRNELFM
jgi:hypothetical protein